MSWRKVRSSVSSVAQSRLLLYECSMPGDFLDVVGLTRPCLHLLAVWLSKMLWCFAKSKDSSPWGGEQLSLRVRRIRSSGDWALALLFRLPNFVKERRHVRQHDFVRPYPLWAPWLITQSSQSFAWRTSRLTLRMINYKYLLFCTVMQR